MTYELYEIVFPNTKKYIGISINAVNRLYAHKTNARSGATMLVSRAIRKYGEDSIRMKVLCVGERDYIRDLEVRAIAAYRTRDRRFGYNVGLGGEHSPVEGIGHSEKSRKKMSRSQKLRVHTPEEVAKMTASLQGRVFTEEHREKLKGPKTEEHLVNLRKAVKAACNKPEVRARISAGLRGRVLSPESRAKISTSLTGRSSPLKGIKRSAEFGAKVSAAKIGKKATPEQLVTLAAGRAKRWPKA